MKTGNRRLLLALGGLALVLICASSLCLGAGALGWSFFQSIGEDESPPEFIDSAPVESTPAPEVEAAPATETQPGPAGVEPQETDSQPAPLGAPFTMFQDPQGFYSLEYPQNWIVQQAGSQQQFCLQEQAETCFSVSLRIKALSYIKLQEEATQGMQETLGDYQESGQQELFLGGMPAVLVDQTYVWQGVSQRGFAAFVVRNRIGFELMAWAPEDAYENFADIFAQMAESFQITEYALAPLYEDWQFYQSEHLTFYYLPGTWIEEFIAAIADDHEWAFGKNQEALGVTHNGIITYFLYPSQESLYRSTARESGFAINEAGEVHALWISADNSQSLGHEMTHVITYWTLGEPSEALLGEGIAVCLDRSRKDYRQIGRDLLSQGSWIPLDKMTGGSWFDQDPAISYPESGAFACYLLETYGPEAFRQLYPRADFRTGLQEVLGTDLDTLEANLQAWLQTQ